MPQVRSSKNRSLSITPKLAQAVGIDPNTVFNVVKQDGKVVLEPVFDAMKARLDAAIAEGLQDFEEGRTSPVFTDMDKAIAWLNSQDE